MTLMRKARNGGEYVHRGKSERGKGFMWKWAGDTSHSLGTTAPCLVLMQVNEYSKLDFVKQGGNVLYHTQRIHIADIAHTAIEYV